MNSSHVPGNPPETRSVGEESANLLRAIVHGTPDNLFIKDLSFRYVMVNDTCSKFMGKPVEDIIGKTDFDLFGKGVAEALRQQDARVLNTGQAHAFERSHRVAGSSHHMFTNLTAWRNEAGDIVGIIGVSRDVTESKQQERRQTARYLLTQVLADANSLEEAAPQLLKVLCGSVDAQFAALWTVDEASQALRCAATWRPARNRFPTFDKACRVRTYHPGEGIPGRVWSTGEVVWSPKVDKDPEFLRKEAALADGLRSAVGFPIEYRKTIFGVVEFFITADLEPNQGFLLLMAGLGGQIGQFVQRRQAEDSLKQSESQLALIVEACGSLLRSLEVKDVLANLIDLSTRLIQSDAVAIWRRAEGREEWRVLGSAGLSDWYCEQIINSPYLKYDPLTQVTPVEDVYQAELLQQRREMYQREGIKSILIAPLLIGPTPGTLVYYFKAQRRFSELEIRGSSGLANLVGAALQTAELYEQQRASRRIAEDARQALSEESKALETERGRLATALTHEHETQERLSQALGQLHVALEDERDLIERMAESFLGKVPSIPGLDVFSLYEAALKAERVGGDYFDFIPINEYLIGIVIGDVCGKGLAAAKYTAMAKYMLRAFLNEEIEPPRILERLNTALYAEMSDEGMFVTMVYGVLDRRTHVFSFANAGHPPPVLYHPSHGPRWLNATGGFLGALPELTFKQETVTLQPGSVLLLYTDGVTESDMQHRLTDEEMEQVLSETAGQGAESIARSIFRMALQRAGGNQRDDIAIVVIRNQERD